MQMPTYPWLFGQFATMAIVFVVIFIVLVTLMFALFFRHGLAAAESFVTEVPALFAGVPVSAEQERTDSDIRTVRLPTKCPSCGAALSPEDIDWVGPLEAKCNYCGGVVRARLESL